MNGVTQKPRLLWIAVKLFDKSVDKATWLETTKNMSRDFDVHFLTGWRDRPVDISICGHPIQYFPQYGRGSLRKVSRRFLMRGEARRQIRRLLPDIVILNCTDNMSMMRTIAKACRQNGCKVILDIRTLPTIDGDKRAWRAFRKGLEFASQCFDGITYITDEMRCYCRERYHLPSHPSAIWTSGVNTDVFCSGDQRSKDGPFRLIYHGGTISVSRGLDRLIRAMGGVSDLDVELTLISSLREPAAIQWIDRLNLSNQVTLLDTIPHSEVPAQIHRCHAGILPFPRCDAWNTSSPIKLFEYMACGKAVIVTDIPAHRNVLKDKPFAFFASDASPEALADAIRNAYAARDRLSTLGQAARQCVLTEYTWMRQAERLGAFAKRVLES